MAIFRYIPSAFQSAAGFLSTYEHHPELTMDIIRKLQKKIKKDNFEFAVLSNAFTEVPDLIEYDKVLQHEGIKTYSDSGGLQVLTRGLDITTELKEKIYNDQCNYSDLAMCFDELPVRTLGKRSESGSSMIDNSGRYFIDSLFQTDGTKTGKNVLEQIKIFKALHLANKNNTIGGKPHGKVLIILQGRDFPTLREFAWFLHQEIKDEPNWTDYVEGLAIGNTTNIGTAGLTDSILRFQKELDFFPDSIKNNIHILGAGTINKIFSFFLMPEGYWNTKDFILSADSTTQTKAMQFGKYITFDGEKKVDIQTGRELNNVTESVTTEIYEFHKEELKLHQMEVNACNKKITDLKLKMKEALDNGSTKEEISAKYKKELSKLEAEAFRQNYTQYNKYLPSEFNLKCTKTKKESLRLRDQFSPHGSKKLETPKEQPLAQYQYMKRSIFSKYFWTMKMINDYFEHLSAVRNTVKDYSTNLLSKEEMNNRMSKLLNTDIYKHLLTVSTHKEYMGDSEILSGHPYKDISHLTLTQVQENGKDIEKVFSDTKGNIYITDVYEGIMRGRILEKPDLGTVITGNKIPMNTVSSVHDYVLSTLSSYKLPMVPYEEYDISEYEESLLIKAKELSRKEEEQLRIKEAKKINDKISINDDEW